VSHQAAIAATNLEAALAAERDREWKDANVIARLRREIAEVTGKRDGEVAGLARRLAASEAAKDGAESERERLSRELSASESARLTLVERERRARDEVSAMEHRMRALAAELEDAQAQARAGRQTREEMNRISEHSAALQARLETREAELAEARRSTEAAQASAREKKSEIEQLRATMASLAHDADLAADKYRASASRAAEAAEEARRDAAQWEERLHSARSKVTQLQERILELEGERARLHAILTTSTTATTTVTTTTSSSSSSSSATSASFASFVHGAGDRSPSPHPPAQQHHHLPAVSAADAEKAALALRAEARRLHVEVESFSMRLAKANSEVQAEHERSAAQRREMAMAAELAQARASELEEHVLRLTRERAHVAERAESAQRARERVADDLEKVQAQVTAAEARAEEQSRARRELDARAAALAESERQLKDQVARLKQRAEMDRESEDRLNLSVAHLRMELDERLSELHSRTAECSSLRAELSDLLDARSQVQAAKQAAEDHVAQLSSQLSEAHGHHQRASAELVRLEGELRSARVALEDHRADLAHERGLRGVLEEEKRSAQAQLAELHHAHRLSETALREASDELRRILHVLVPGFSSSSSSTSTTTISTSTVSSSHLSSITASVISAMRQTLAEAAAAASSTAKEAAAHREKLAQNEGDLEACVTFLAGLLKRVNSAVSPSSGASSSSRPGSRSQSPSGHSSPINARTLQSSFESLKTRIWDGVGAVASQRDAAVAELFATKEILSSVEKRSSSMGAALEVAAETEARLQKKVSQLFGGLSVLVRAFAPTHARLQELLVQKHYLTSCVKSHEHLAKEISRLAAQAQLGGGPAGHLHQHHPAHVRPVTLRAAALAVIAARRLWGYMSTPRSHRAVNVFLSGTLTPILATAAGHAAGLDIPVPDARMGPRDEAAYTRALVSALLGFDAHSSVDTVMPFSRPIMAGGRRRRDLAARLGPSHASEGLLALRPASITVGWMLGEGGLGAVRSSFNALLHKAEASAAALSRAESNLRRTMEVNSGLESVVSGLQAQQEVTVRELEETRVILTNNREDQEKEIREAIGHMRLLKDKNERLAKALLEAEDALRERDALIKEYDLAVQRHYADKVALEAQERSLINEIKALDTDIIVIGDEVQSLL
jgi:chromosome segregation ATPase